MCPHLDSLGVCPPTAPVLLQSPSLPQVNFSICMLRGLPASTLSAPSTQQRRSILKHISEHGAPLLKSLHQLPD